MKTGVKKSDKRKKDGEEVIIVKDEKWTRRKEGKKRRIMRKKIGKEKKKHKNGKWVKNKTKC